MRIELGRSKGQGKPLLQCGNSWQFPDSMCSPKGSHTFEPPAFNVSSKGTPAVAACGTFLCSSTKPLRYSSVVQAAANSEIASRLQRPRGVMAERLFLWKSARALLIG